MIQEVEAGATQLYIVPHLSNALAHYLLKLCSILLYLFFMLHFSCVYIFLFSVG